MLSIWGFCPPSEAREVDKQTPIEPLLVLRFHDHLENFISEMNEQRLIIFLVVFSYFSWGFFDPSVDEKEYQR